MIKVKSIRCHVGAQIGAQVFSSVHEDKQKAEMYVAVVGVSIDMNLPEIAVVPWPTISSFHITRETYNTLKGTGFFLALPEVEEKAVIVKNKAKAIA